MTRRSVPLAFVVGLILGALPTSFAQQPSMTSARTTYEIDLSTLSEEHSRKMGTTPGLKLYAIADESTARALGFDQGRIAISEGTCPSLEMELADCYRKLEECQGSSNDL